MNDVMDTDKNSLGWLEEVKTITNKIESCSWDELNSLYLRLKDIHLKVRFPHVYEYMEYNAGIQTVCSGGFDCGKPLDSYPPDQLKDIVKLLWETIPQKVIRRVRKHLKETPQYQWSKDLSEFYDIYAECDYGFEIHAELLQDIARDELRDLLDIKNAPDCAILLRDQFRGLYKISLWQEPKLHGTMRIRWGNYCRCIDIEELVQNLTKSDDKVVDLETDKCRNWLAKVYYLKKTGLRKSHSEWDSYNLCIFFRDSSWSLESFDRHYAFTSKEWDDIWKSKCDELAGNIMSRADRELPLCHQRDISRMVHWIPEKESNRVTFIWDGARLLEFTDDSDWIFIHLGTPVDPGLAKYLNLGIRICIRDSTPKTGYVIYRYCNIEREGILDHTLCAEFIRLGEKYFSIPHKSPLIPPPKDSKFIVLDGYMCALKVANRTQSIPLEGFNMAHCVDTDHPAYRLTWMMFQMVFFQARREHIITYNREMDEFNRKGVPCPHCKSHNINYIDGKNRRKSYWHCKDCGRQFKKEHLANQS